MAHGDTGSGVAKIRFVDAPKGNGPWRIKTDAANGIPEVLKSWDPIEAHPGELAEIAWEEKHHTAQNGKTYEDKWIESCVSVGGAPDGTANTGAAREYTPTRFELVKDARISYWAAVDRANAQLGEGATVEEYLARAAKLLDGLTAYVENAVPEAPEPEPQPEPASSEERTEPDTSSDDNVPF